MYKYKFRVLELNDGQKELLIVWETGVKLTQMI